MADAFSCWQRFGTSDDSSSRVEPEAAAVGWGSAVDDTGSSAAQGNSHGWRWFRDPRLGSLGFRGIFPSDATRKSLKWHQACLTVLWSITCASPSLIFPFLFTLTS